MLTEGKETRMTQPIPFSHFLYRKMVFIQKGHSRPVGSETPKSQKVCSSCSRKSVRCLAQVSVWVLEMRL